jgi:hypothetical protein
MNQWDNFVASHPDGTPYHLSGWLKTIVDAYGFKPLLYGAQDADGTLSAVFPLFKINDVLRGSRLISLPFSDYGGPLFRPHVEGSEIIASLRKNTEKDVRFIEIRGNMPETEGFVSNKYYKRHLVDLRKKVPDMLKTIDKKTIQYGIRKAEKSGITIKEANDASGMREFTRLNMLTRKKHGVPSQPTIWFEQLLKSVITAGNGFILTAELNNQVIGASLFLKCGQKLHYKYNASDPAILRSASPNHLLTWTAIKWGNENNFITLDFGRTSPDNEGLMRYKEMWGAIVVDIPYFYYPKIKGATSIQEKNYFYRLSTRGWRLLPNFIAEKFSKVVYKYLA